MAARPPFIAPDRRALYGSEERRGDESLVPVLVGVVGIAVVLVLFGYSMTLTSYDGFASLIVGLALLGLTWPVARHVARVEGDPRLMWFLMLAVMLKLLSAVARHYVAFDIYGGQADAARYHASGVLLGDSYRHLIFVGAQPGNTLPFQTIEVLTGLIYAVIGPTQLGGFLVVAGPGVLSP